MAGPSPVQQPHFWVFLALLVSVSGASAVPASLTGLPLPHFPNFIIASSTGLIILMVFYS